MVAYIAMVMFGTSREAARSVLFCLVVMRYVIRTVFGDSELAYGGEKWTQTPHGMGQGNGCAPAVWNAISSPLFEILREEGYGMEIVSPLTETLLFIAGFGFVDDTDLVQGAKRGESIENLVKRTQELLTLWEELLRVTGGALDVKDKSDWTLIAFEWKQGKSKLKPIDRNVVLKVRDHEGDIVEMKQISSTSARETLGVMQAPSGIEDEEEKYLHEKVKAWNKKIYTSGLRRHDVTKAVNMTIVRTIRYGLVATALNFKQCDKLTRTLLRVALPKMGIVRTASNVLATAPIRYRGLGIVNFDILQMVDHLRIACDHGDSDSDTGQLLRTTLETTQIQTGIGENPLYIKPSIITWIEQSWWSNTFEAMERYKVKLHGNMTGLKTWTSNDSIFMDDILEQYGTNESKAFYESVNRMRLFHQVTTRSDLQHACGKLLKTAILSNRINDDKTRSGMAYRWPKQGTPTIHDAINWTLAIEETYGVKKEQPIFPVDLRGRKWKIESHAKQQWVYSQETNVLYRREDKHKWSTWRCSKGRTRRQAHTFNKTEQFEENLQNVIPASVNKCDNEKVIMISTGRYEQTSTTNSRAVNDLEDSSDWLLQRIHIPADGGKKFCEQIKNNEATTCGDGSYKSGKATGGSLSFEKDSMKIGVRIDNEVPIDPEDASAYAGELGGIGGMVVATNALCKKFKVVEGTVTHGVDNDAALSNCFGPYEPTTLTPCFHIVKRIRAAIKMSPIKWIGKKVKAHQDETSNIEQLDCWAKANILADKQAKAHLRRVLRQDNRSSIQQYENEGWTVQIGEKRITKKFEKQIIYHCTKEAIKQYWCERFAIDRDNWDSIDWKVFVRATKEMSISRRLFITKHAAGISATGRNMLRRKEHETSQCPRCKQDDEHTYHIFTCQGKGTQEIFNTGLAELSIWLEKTTSQEMEEAITTFLTIHRNEETEDWNQWEGSDAIKEALIGQENIGPEAFLSGIVTVGWAKAQRIYFDRIESRKCEIKWTATLTLKIIDIISDLWKHRNDALHQRDNVVRERDHDRLNKEIETCMKELPRSLRVFTPAEQRFFKRTKIQKLKQCKIKQKKQWIATARSIITGFKENLHKNPQARTMWTALNLWQKNRQQTTDTQNQTDEQTRQENEQYASDDLENTTQESEKQEKNLYIRKKTSERENSKRNNDLHTIQNTKNKNDKNDPNG